MQTPEESLHAPESGPNEMPEQSTTSSIGDAVNTELSAENAAEVIAETEIPEEVPFTPAPEEIPATEPVPAEESPEPEDAHVEAVSEAPAEIVQEETASTVENEPIATEVLKDEEEDSSEVDLHEDLHPVVAFQELSRIELVAAMQEAVDSEDTDGMRMRVRAIREGYYKVKDEEVASKRLKFIENGGLAEEFEILRDETDEQFDALVKRFQEKRADQRRKREQELITNLRKKEGILAELKAMLENTENISASFDRLHELQEQWRSIGLVPVQYEIGRAHV